MAEEKNQDYKARLNRARNRRNGKDPMKYFMIGAACVIGILLIVIVGKLLNGGTFRDPEKAAKASAASAETEAAAAARAIAETAPEETEATLSAEELAQQQEDEAKAAVVESYSNLGIVQVSGYLNMRESASKDGKIVGKLLGGSACEILDDESAEGWYQVSSGGLTGYISSEFVLTGEAAKTEAFEQVKKMAVITADKLNVRSEPNQDAQVVEQVLKNERYSIVGEQDGWIQISNGYISADYVDVRYALNEARKLDLRTMVLNMYDNLGISNVNNYLNIRKEPSENGKIIGKMTSKSAGEILEKTEDGEWYKIRSGPVTGYVKSEYILTGDAAKSEALEVAELMAIVSTDRLNARTEPSTDAPIWTQISNSERYAVLKQLDGWVEIELDTTSAYVATDFVDVRYALNEAIQFTPIEDTPKSSTGKGSTGKGGSSGGKTGGGVGNTPGNAAGSSKRTQIANYATQFLGNPYVWGGTSLTNGADCSGFTMAVMSKFGVSLPHHSGSQANCGKSINSSQMRPGDLVFYTNSGGTINHVALYIGNGQVVHASNQRDGIKISTWNYRTPAKIVNVLGD
ncbi:MAG: SH3 domain-containing protein [Otoolea sp.]|nr:SH3 domain-containing protein [Clostridiaceae bacterium]MDD6073095.1 SH3 domain-containing protein [Clostridium sp.]MDY5483285.1 SH3 domain-containing protein [Clostridium sp.]